MISPRIALRLTALAMLCGVLGACAAPKARASDDGVVQPASAAATPVNTRCPISGKPVDSRLTAQYKGTNIGFCSQRTYDQFLEMNDAERDAIAAKARGA